MNLQRKPLDCAVVQNACPHDRIEGTKADELLSLSCECQLCLLFCSFLAIGLLQSKYACSTGV